MFSCSDLKNYIIVISLFIIMIFKLCSEYILHYIGTVYFNLVNISLKSSK